MRVDDAPRVPPHNLEAEQSILGAMLLDRRGCETGRRMLVAQDFYREAHARIFAAVCSVFDLREPVDLVTASAELQKRGQFDDCGGLDYLMTLASSVPTARNAEHYAQIVSEQSLRRQAIEAAQRIEDLAHDELDIAAGCDQMQAALHAVLMRRQTGEGPRHIGEGVMDVTRELEDRDRAARSGATLASTGLPSGLRSLDRVIGFLPAGGLVTIAARPSMGKTTLALNIAAHVAFRVRPQTGESETRQASVLFVSLETSFRRVVERVLLSEGRVDAKAPTEGRMCADDWERVAEAGQRAFGANLLVDDTPRQSVLDIAARARRQREQIGLDLLLVDYLGLMRFRQTRDRHDLAVGEVVADLKHIARELEIPVVLLVQLNRRVETRTTDPDKMRPVLSDMKDSGDIEAHADICLFPWRPEYAAYKMLRDQGDIEPEEPSSTGERAEVLVLKNRDGQTGTAHCMFAGAHRRFFDHAPKYRDEEATYGRTA